MNDLDTIYAISSFVDTNGSPKSSSALVTGTLSEKGGEPRISKTIYLNAPITIRGTGGCTVVTVDFKKNDRKTLLRAGKLCFQWLQEEDPEQALFLQVVPVYYQGALTIILQHLVFCDYYETDSACRMILCFDGTKTVLLKDDEFDFQALEAQVKRDIQSDLQNLDQAIADERKALAEIEEQIAQDYLPDFDIGLPLPDEEEGTTEIDRNTRYSKVSEEEDKE